MKTNVHFTRMQRVYVMGGLICVFLIIGVPALSQAQVSHVVRFSRAKLTFATELAKDRAVYEKVSLANLPQMDATGKPSLPVKYVKLIVPANQDVEKVMVSNVQKQEFTVSHLIFPAQPDIPTSTIFQNPDFVPPDSTVYGSDSPYPAEIVKVVHSGYFDGSNHIVTLAVSPLQYYPKSGRLVFFSWINFTLEMKSAKTVGIYVEGRHERYQKMYDAILQDLVDNPQDIGMYQVKPSLRKSGTLQSTMSLPSYEYVIITSNALKLSFDLFVDWKKRKGVDIGIVTTEEIFTNYSGDLISGIYDDAGKIRQYLSEAYSNGTAWALLAGDYSVVPIRYGAGSKRLST